MKRLLKISLPFTFLVISMFNVFAFEGPCPYKEADDNECGTNKDEELYCGKSACPTDQDMSPSYTYCATDPVWDRCKCVDPSDYGYEVPLCDECSGEDACGGGCEQGYRCVEKTGEHFYTGEPHTVLVCEEDPSCQEDAQCAQLGKCGSSAGMCPTNHVCTDPDNDGKNFVCVLDTAGSYCTPFEGACPRLGECGSARDGNQGKYCELNTNSPYKTYWVDADCLYLHDRSECDCDICCGAVGAYNEECVHNGCGYDARCESGEKCEYYEPDNIWKCSAGEHPDCLAAEKAKESEYKGPVIDSLEKILGPIVKILYYGGLSIGVLFIIISGYKLMVSQGNPQQTQDAQEQLTAAILGIIFILLSVTILRIILGNIIGVSSS